jgi:hypothetical protein
MKKDIHIKSLLDGQKSQGFWDNDKNFSQYVENI